jgi:outer membrane protein assembly factor BamE
MFRQIFILASIILLGGCHYLYEQPISQGTQFSQSQREQIKPGITRQQVIKVMGGEPLLKTVNSNQMIYISTNRQAHSKTQIKKVVITFNKNNEVEKVQAQ